MSNEPFSLTLGGKYGINPYKNKVERRLSDMKEYFLDKHLVEEMLLRGENPLIYTVYEVPREGEGEFNISWTIIYPGKIGKEYYFTKGHFHTKESTSEIYIGISGEGLILMQNRRGEIRVLKIEPNILIYIPPGFAHRSINTGDIELIFLAIYPSDAGHDYITIEKMGFAKIVIEEDGKPALANNPKYLSQA